MKHSEHPTKKSDPTKNKPETKPARDEVAKKAYALYEKEGRPQGHDKQNWLEAEAQMSHTGSDHPKVAPTAPGNAEPPKGKAWHNLSADEVLAQLHSAAMGLSASEAAQRLAANGPNESSLC